MSCRVPGVVFWIFVVINSTVCKNKPNIVIFLADDLGYGDIQAYGNPVSQTPNIDILFRDGLKLTQFYSASTVCSPSRAGLLTGRYPVRHGFWNTQDLRSVLRLNNPLGLPLNETTIAELVADQGYRSALIGKWHLGVGRNREFLPNKQGFDHFFGIPVSIDLCECTVCFSPNISCLSRCSTTAPPCPLFLEDEIIEQPVDLTRLAERQAFAAERWINEFIEDGSPFILMYWFVHPHTPHFASPKFHNSTLGGQFTDSLAELDWQVGQVISAIKETGQFDDTLFLFTSDNGPDKLVGVLGGSSGPLRCGKGSTFEGGTRVPGALYWPSRISAGISTEFVTHLDILPTIASIIGSSVKDYNIQLDGYDISNVIFNNGKSSRPTLLYFNSTAHPADGSFALRHNQYKAHYITLAPPDMSDPNDYDIRCRSAVLPFTRHDPPLLYNLLLDPEERVSLQDKNHFEEILNELETVKILEESQITYGDSIIHDFDDSIQACCNERCEPFPKCCRCVSNYSDALFVISKRTSMSSSVSISIIVFVAIFILSIMYAIMCVVLINSRRQKDDEYISLS